MQAGGATMLAAAMPVLRTARAQSAPQVREVGRSLYVLNAGGSNVLAHTAAAQTTLVDGGSRADADALIDAVAELPGAGPVSTLFNTHWHPDQTGANARLAAAGARIIAQENTRLWLASDITYPWDGQHFAPLPEADRPTETFYDDGGELDTGVRYGYLRHAAHTDGDLYVHFPVQNVLAVGGAIRADAWPFVDWWTGGWIGGVVGTLELVHSLCDADTRIVAAQGPDMRRDDIERLLDIYNVVYERLAEMLNRGRGPDEAVAARPTAQFDDQLGPSEDFVRQAFMSLWAYLSPDA